MPIPKRKAVWGKTSHSVALRVLQAGSPSEGAVEEIVTLITADLPISSVNTSADSTNCSYYVYHLQLVESVKSELDLTP